MIKPNEKIYFAYFVKKISRYEINASCFQDTKLSEKEVCTGDMILRATGKIDRTYIKRNIEFQIVQIFMAKGI